MSGSGYRDAAEKTKTLAHQENEKRKRILIVEDNYPCLTLVNDVLKAHGYQTLETTKGLEAINLAR